MSRFFREAAPLPVDPNQRLHETLIRRQDQAAAYIERALAANRGNTAVTDILLDLRLILRPSAPSA